MTAIGTFTDAYRAKYAEVADLGQALDEMKLSYFKFGEANKQPGDPSETVPHPTYTDIVAPDDNTAGGVGSQGTRYYKETLDPSDVTAASNVLTVVCEVSSTEANWTPTGAFFEIGIFDENDEMMAYASLDEQNKTALKGLRNTLTISF